MKRFPRATPGCRKIPGGSTNDKSLDLCEDDMEANPEERLKFDVEFDVELPVFLLQPKLVSKLSVGESRLTGLCRSRQENKESVEVEVDKCLRMPREAANLASLFNTVRMVSCSSSVRKLRSIMHQVSQCSGDTNPPSPVHDKRTDDLKMETNGHMFEEHYT
ncbi:hypothetical protein EYF80_009608 [Liparis tanakae]|uniref:Uncharacterized protein n=1 Tax=Liparis tanakae TaxID=230148 RepID=A0A4Z2IR55_9TELE|nr:hypothetical protein EYF80_009608 [Liparis tanakae]